MVFVVVVLVPTLRAPTLRAFSCCSPTLFVACAPTLGSPTLLVVVFVGFFFAPTFGALAVVVVFVVGPAVVVLVLVAFGAGNVANVPHHATGA